MIMKLIRKDQFCDRVGISMSALHYRLANDFLSPKPKKWAGTTPYFSEIELCEWHAVYEDMKDVSFKYRTEFNGVQL